jgi:AcrR family transcriptional regulator
MTAPRTPEASRLLSLAAAYMLERGVSGISLSRLAKDIGSNNRMLLYYFGSKDELFSAALRTAYASFPELQGLMAELQAPGGDLHGRIDRGWRALRASENLPYVRLFFEAFALAARDPAANGAQLADIASDWPLGLTRMFASHGYGDAEAREAATQLLALWRGLQFLLLEGTDVRELDRAHDHAVAAMFPARPRTAAS